MSLQKKLIFAPEQFLLRAAADGDVDLVSMLLLAGADKNTRDERGRTPLFLAAMNGRVSVVAGVDLSRCCS